MYKLSSTLYGHDDDVKALSNLGEDTIISGSRDSTVRIWNRLDKENTKDFSSSIINLKTEGFVNSLAIYNYQSELLIVSGGNDNMVHLTSPNSVFTDSEEYCFIGHTANICTLDTYENLVLSGSWDCTAKVWSKETGAVLYDLRGHENSVWGARFLNENEYLTCGADRTVRKWSKDKQVKCFIAHDDVVRDLLLLPSGDFVTCSNDTTIKIWDGVTFDLKATLVGHQSFIYSIGLTSTGDIVSCGEDRSIRIWRNYQCIQVIVLPCISVWKVMVLPNDDIVTASSDRLIRIFTNNARRYAKENEVLAFRKQLEESSISESVLANVNKQALPPLESLDTDLPTIEGETRMVKSGFDILIYQWSVGKWLKIGQVVNGASSNQKQLYNGKYYDYLFNIDVEDGQPPLKLPVNISDNPYEVADKFLATNDLPQSYQQQIVEFILQNTEGMNMDTKPTDLRYGSTPKSEGLIPQTQYLAFEKMDIPKLISAFNKLNGKQSEGNILSGFETLINCEDYTELHHLALEIIKRWDQDSKLLGFDILRCIITKIQPSEELFPIIRSGLEMENPKVQMMAVRILVNTFKCKGWGEQVMLDEDILSIIFTDGLFDNLANKIALLPTTIATLILNYSVLTNKYQLINFHKKLLIIISKLLKYPAILDNDESSYRLLAAIGTLDHMKSIENKAEYLLAFANKDEERFSILRNEIS